MQLQSESGPFSLPDERDLAERSTRAEPIEATLPSGALSTEPFTMLDPNHGAAMGMLDPNGKLSGYTIGRVIGINITQPVPSVEMTLDCPVEISTEERDGKTVIVLRSTKDDPKPAKQPPSPRLNRLLPPAQDVARTPG